SGLANYSGGIGYTFRCFVLKQKIAQAFMEKDTKVLRSDLPNLDESLLGPPDLNRLFPKEITLHPPRIVLLYGSVRERSYSRFVTEEAAKILNKLGAETRIFDPRGLPQPDGAAE